MSLRVWVHSIGQDQKRPKESIIGSLSENGFILVEFNPGFAQGPGIFLFDEVSGNICNLVQEISRNGQEYVLALGCREVSRQAAWQLIHAGAADVLSCVEADRATEEIIVRLHRWDAVERLMRSAAVLNAVVGESPSWRRTLRQILEVAHFTDSAVLILGESGTGKELIARLVHALDARPSKKELVILDCSTIVPELSGSEFFGHERGAFTGAVSARDGAFALAEGGTLFLDEVGELPERLQAQLLRVIQERSFKRVGGSAWRRSSFRLVCATNRDLWAQVQEGRFRTDLYYRIASFICNLPPLRERSEDIIPLAHYFLQELGPDRPSPELDPAVQHYLINREYPGNVRDLKQVVTRMWYRSAGCGRITVGSIPPEDRLSLPENVSEWRDAAFDQAIYRALRQGVGLKEIGRKAEQTAIRIALDETRGNLQRAAIRLGVTDRALQIRRAAQRQEV
jgi:transcriptional regulator with GAF, ATPase, and Fis domain